MDCIRFKLALYLLEMVESVDSFCTTGCERRNPKNGAEKRRS